MKFARPLHSNDLAFRFLTSALSIEKKKAGDYAIHVAKAESLLEKMNAQPTLSHEENRHPACRTDDSRELMRSKVFSDLINLVRLDDDDQIALAHGGAKPATDIKYENQAYILVGLPASGKSRIVSNISDKFGAYVIDSDYAMRKFPEYKHEFGASILHEESTLVTYGPTNENDTEEPSLLEYCIADKINLIIPKIGHSRKSLRTLRDLLIDRGYSVHLTLVCLERVESCKRALIRYMDTNRYVPLGLLFDGYGNDPILTYFRVKDDDSWESTGKVSSLNLSKSGPTYIEGDNKNPSYMFKKAPDDEKTQKDNNEKEGS